MGDHRIETVLRAMCQWTKRCTGCGDSCRSNAISQEYVRTILQAVDEADRAAGIYRVPFEPDHLQVMAGLRCAMKGESPRITYQNMLVARLTDH